MWVDGEPHEVPHQPFDGLDGVGDLRFTALATRAKHENYLLLKSDYEQPFGTFEGELPVAGPRARLGRDGTSHSAVVNLATVVM